MLALPLGWYWGASQLWDTVPSPPSARGLSLLPSCWDTFQYRGRLPHPLRVDSCLGALSPGDRRLLGATSWWVSRSGSMKNSKPGQCGGESLG